MELRLVVCQICSADLFMVVLVMGGFDSVPSPSAPHRDGWAQREFLSSSAGNSGENTNSEAGGGSRNVGSHWFGNPLEQTWLQMQLLLKSDLIYGGRRNIG